jgi:hypothetical protein
MGCSNRLRFHRRSVDAETPWRQEPGLELNESALSPRFDEA